MSNKSGAMIGGIQVLRALAAVLVTLCHAQAEVAKIGELPSAWPPPVLANLAGFGVQLFFVISGFIMVYSTESLFGAANGPLVFLKRRLVRIVPLYWIVTSIYLALTLLVPEFAKGYPVSFVVASYLFIPAARPDGVIEPLVGQGWSLNYEMLFYLIFAATVFASRRVSVMMVTAILLSLVIFGNIIPSLPLILSSWTSPILLHFVFGIWIGLAYREGISLTPTFGLALIGTATVLLGLELSPFAQPLAIAVGSWCAPALIVAGVVLPRLSFNGLLWSLTIIIGTASYALFLFHAIPIRALFYLAHWANFDIGHAPNVYVSAAVALAILLAIVIYYCVERPIMRAARPAGSEPVIAMPAQIVT